MTRKTPSDDEIRKRFGVQVDGLEKAPAKKMAAFQVDMVAFAKDVREYLEPGPATDEVWNSLDKLQRSVVSAIKDPEASSKPGPKAGTPKAAPKPPPAPPGAKKTETPPADPIAPVIQISSGTPEVSNGDGSGDPAAAGGEGNGNAEVLTPAA